MSRHEILKPKTQLVIKHLQHNNPAVLNKYTDVNLSNKAIKDKVFIVMPFYKNMYDFKRLCLDFIVKEAMKGKNV